ncbi:hypothetical protein KC19_3G224700 [Ceratodon purpureus]|uniref:Secreted protein n=1 Tax=Ceratodon purpureus TaxID=3225 RepID=A0A8T0INQ9_CERPU|nr:hypothetical protein KC19_3G224700 [Ceratodon purpureus]
MLIAHCLALPLPFSHAAVGYRVAQADTSATFSSFCSCLCVSHLPGYASLVASTDSGYRQSGSNVGWHRVLYLESRVARTGKGFSKWIGLCFSEK